MPTVPFLSIITKDLTRVKVSLPGCKLKAADRYGDDPWCIHGRLQKCVHDVMVPKFGYDTSNKDSNARPLTDTTLWKDSFLCVDLPASTLGSTRQLALDLAASDPVELFGTSENDLYDPEKKVFKHVNDQVAAFLAAKELLPDEIMVAFKKALGKIFSSYTAHCAESNFLSNHQTLFLAHNTQTTSKGRESTTWFQERKTQRVLLVSLPRSRMPFAKQIRRVPASCDFQYCKTLSTTLHSTK
jgi:hypothetical protein